MRFRELQVSYRAVAGTPPGPRPQIGTPRDGANLLAPLLAHKVVEHAGVLSLDTKHSVIGWDVIGIGSLDATVVHPREVFLTAILQHAAAIIVAHNHPSGDPVPSLDDKTLTARLSAAGGLLGIPLIDHVIIGHDGRYYSFREAGQL